eukprot:PhF_6_TR27821/c1_g1_i2/m.40583
MNYPLALIPYGTTPNRSPPPRTRLVPHRDKDDTTTLTELANKTLKRMHAARRHKERMQSPPPSRYEVPTSGSTQLGWLSDSTIHHESHLQQQHHHNHQPVVLFAELCRRADYLWGLLDEPTQHRHEFRRCHFNEDNPLNRHSIQLEIARLLKEKDIVQVATTSLQHRDVVLQELRDIASNYRTWGSQGTAKALDNIRHELRLTIHRYRESTLSAAEQIVHWTAVTGKRSFRHRGRVYLLEMCIDLWNTVFRNEPLQYLTGMEIPWNPFMLSDGVVLRFERHAKAKPFINHKANVPPTDSNNTINGPSLKIVVSRLKPMAGIEALPRPPDSVVNRCREIRVAILYEVGLIVRVMQRYLKGNAVRKRIHRCHKMATKIQRVFRGHSARKQYLHLQQCKSLQVIVPWMRMAVVRCHYLRQIQCAVIVQSGWRGWRVRVQLYLRRQAAFTIQCCVLWWLRNRRRARVMLCNVASGYIHRNRLRDARRRAQISTCISLFVKMRISRGIVNIRKTARGIMRMKRTIAVKCIQRFYRGYREMRAHRDACRYRA